MFFGKRKLTKWKEVREKLVALASILKKSGVNFKYETLEKATNYFDISNKLGQGGSGTVFKGVLQSGKVVAVKRLYFGSRQWVDQFFNEVNLIIDINHKNLVKLLGCSITGPESLLVYEYVPNKTLHHYLSDARYAQLLTWETRYNIVVGVAEGLAYLHEESQLRIIHRDIKLSNVLLDENYTAKIGDFGLARLFPEDRSHLSTGIAGTVGYMSPEYIVRGKLTDKADVFSFGILMIEVITGKINHSQPENPVLHMVWNLYLSNRMSEAVDPVLEGSFPVEKATRLLHIALLCGQASDELRPSMSKVVKMLRDDSKLPGPMQPPFLPNWKQGSPTPSLENMIWSTIEGR